MPEPHFTTLDDDLPRTFKRERDAREREAKEREAREREASEREAPSVLRKAAAAMADARPTPDPIATGPRLGEPVTVSRLDVPFGHLVAFFFKAVFAALPALLLLTVILWGIGEMLQRAFPWLIKMRILIQFPN